MPVEERRLEVDHVAECRQDLIDPFGGDGEDWFGFDIEQDLVNVDGVKPR